MVNAQEWLDREYPIERRNRINNLNISNQQLSGSLDLSSFTDLEILDCSHNNLTSLFMGNPVDLIFFNCSNNELTELSFLTNLNSEILTNLNICHNKFPHLGQNLLDLNVFSQFINLETLDVSNNSFVGSLAPLKNLERLRLLNIKDTRIDSGLEDLHERLNREELRENLSENKNYNAYITTNY